MTKARGVKKRLISLMIVFIMLAGFIPGSLFAQLTAKAANTSEDNPIIFTARGGVNTEGEVEYRIYVEELYPYITYQSFTITYPKELELWYDKPYNNNTADLTQYWTLFHNTDSDPKSVNGIVFTGPRSPSGLRQDLESIHFKQVKPDKFPPEGSTITVTVTKDKVTFFQDERGYVHYYMFVPWASAPGGTFHSWIDAYNDAKTRTMQDPRYPDDPTKVLQGYLATLTSEAEHAQVYAAIATQCGWLGGTRLMFNGGGRIQDTDKIGNSFLANGRWNTAEMTTLFDANYGLTTAIPGHRSNADRYWYWACGPEAWTYYDEAYFTAGKTDAFVYGYKDEAAIDAGLAVEQGKPGAAGKPASQLMFYSLSTYTGTTSLVEANRYTVGNVKGVYNNFANPYGIRHNTSGAATGAATGAEPNDSSNETALQFAWNAADTWNDYRYDNSGSINGYYVEFGGYPGDPKASELVGGRVTTTSEVELVMPMLVQYRSTVQDPDTLSYYPIAQIGISRDRAMTYESTIPFTVVRNFGLFDWNLTGFTPYGYAFYGSAEDAAQLTLKANGDVDGFYSTHTQRILFLFKPDEYKLTFDANFEGWSSANVSPGSKTIRFDSPYGELALARRPGYMLDYKTEHITFFDRDENSCWNTQADGKGETVFPGMFVQGIGDRTLYAQWIEKSDYSVHYDLNGGTGDNTSKYPVSWTESGLLPAEPTRDGYVFVGWDVSLNGSKQNVSTSDTYGSLVINDVEPSITLQAQWIAETIMMVFYQLNGADTPSAIPDMTIPALTSIVPMPAATRAGYAFDGWKVTNDGSGVAGATFSAGTGGVTFGGIAVVDSNFVILEAQWTEKTYTVKYDNNDVPASSGTSLTDVFWHQNGLVPPSGGNPTWDHHIFMGWNTARNGSGDTVYVGSTYAQLAKLDTVLEITLYAQWVEERTYFVSYDTNGGLPADIDDKTRVYLNDANLLPETEPTPPVGFVFSGWSVSYNGMKAGITEFDTFGELASDPNLGFIILKAQYSPKGGLIVYYDTNGHPQPTPPTPPAGELPLPPYPASKTSLIWTQSNLLPTPNPVSAGYIFLGWNTMPNGSGIAASSSDTFGFLAGGNDALTSVTLYAQWAPIVTDKYTVIYNSNGGSAIPNAVLDNANDPVPLVPPATPPSGYVFSYWTVEDNGNSQGTGSATKDKENPKFEDLAYGSGSSMKLFIKLRAVYTERSVFNVEYDKNYDGGGIIHTETGVSWTQMGHVPYTYYRPGWNLIGWKAEINGAEGFVLPGTQYRALANGNDAVTSVTLTAQWERASFLVRYDLNGVGIPADAGGAFDQQTVGYDDTGLVPAYTLKRIGFTLTGWNVSENGSKQNVASTDSFRTLAYSGSLYITLQAQWVPKEYTVHYDINGGTPTSIPSYTVSWATNDLLPATPTRSGYIFDGWKLTRIDGAAVTPGGFITSSVRYSDLADVNGYDSGSITLQAQWSINNSYTVSYDLNAPSGTVTPASIAPLTGLSWGSSGLLPGGPNPTRNDSQRFLGWKVSMIGVTPVLPLGAYVTASDTYSSLDFNDVGSITLQAQWEHNDGYNIYYDLEGGTATPPVADIVGIVNGTDTNLIPAGVIITKSGYTFSGWELAKRGEDPVSPAVVPVTATSIYNTLADGTGATSLTIRAAYTEDPPIAVNYIAMTEGVVGASAVGGTVSPTSESLRPVTGVALGSTATANNNYSFKGWFISGADFDNSTPLSTNINFTPAKVDGLNVAATYVAYFTLIKYSATVTVNKDGILWTDASRPVITLRKDDAGTAISNFSGLTFGSYTIYANGVSTGIAMTVDHANNSATLNYYTVRYAVSDAGDASGSTISATYDGNAITSGAVVLGGKTLAITAAGAGLTVPPGSYSYLWTGAGTNEQITSSITITGLSQAVNARCAVNGTYPYAVTIKVVDENGDPVENVKVTIWQSGKDLAHGDTDNNGIFNPGELETGIYNVELEYEDDEGVITIVTRFLRVDRNSNNDFILTIPLLYQGRLDSQFVQPDNMAVPVVAVDNLHDVFNAPLAGSNEKGITKDDIDVFDAGGEILIRLEASAVSAGQANESSAIIDMIDGDGKKFGFEIDLSAYKDIWEAGEPAPDITQLEELNGLVKIYIYLPDSPINLQGQSGYAVYRYHGDFDPGKEPERLPQWPVKNKDGEYFEVDPAGTVITLTVKKFSVYTVAYNDPAGPDVTVTLIPNGGIVAPATRTLSPGDSWTLSAPIRSGYIFAGWLDSNGVFYPVGVPIVINDDIILIAQWTLNSGGGGDGDEDGPGIGTPVIQPKPPLLNNRDHFAYVIGYPDGNIHPEGLITRAEVATVFFRLLEDDIRSANLSSDNEQSDVAKEHWFNTAVSTHEKLGIIQGYPDGSFRPDNNITRAEFVTVIVRFFAAIDTSGTMPFSDVPDGYWAADYIVAAYNAGIVRGYPDGTFHPEEPISRAEAITLINSLLNRHVESVDDMLPDMVTWGDNADTNAWYYYAIQEATNSHDYKRKEDSIFEIWDAILPNRDWTVYEQH